MALGALGQALAMMLYGFAHEPLMAFTASIIAGASWIAALATLIGRSAHTVRTHIRNAGGKLEAHGRLGMVSRARQLGLLPYPDRP